MSILKKISWKHKALFGGILAVALVHSLVQLSFIQSETLRPAELAAQIGQPEIETKQPEQIVIDIEPREYDVRKVKVTTIPENAPATRRPIEVKKKVVRETRAARLRRAERILTGV